jgi:hypothetical protein
VRPLVIAGAVRAQFGRPHGIGGRAVGVLLAHRSSNRRRNAWVVSLLDVQPGDRVLEIGFGPGLAMRGLIAVAHQPRGPGASDETSASIGREIAAALRRAGFSEVRVETMRLKPAVVCALGVNETGA